LEERREEEDFLTDLESTLGAVLRTVEIEVGIIIFTCGNCFSGALIILGIIVVG